MLNARDLRALKKPLMALGGVLAAGAILLYATGLTLSSAEHALAREQQQLRDARTRLQKAGEEKGLIERYLARYQYLQQLGFVGEEQRINWLDGLRLANQQLQLFGIDYTISAQQTYPYAADLDPGPMALYQSVMKLDFRLLHEADLLRFFDMLAKQGAGVFSVNQCVIDRLPAAGSAVVFQPNLHAECELAWITLKPESAGEKKS